MENKYRKREDCRLCGSRNMVLAVPMRQCPIGDAFTSPDEAAKSKFLYPMDLYLCQNCFHLQLPFVVDPVELFSNYIYSTSTSPGLISHFEKYCDDVVRKLELKGAGLVIDIGSNDGTLLGFFSKKGFRTLGIDPAKSIAEKASARGIETWARFFNLSVASEIFEQRGRASLICANNVFAHADDMMGIAEGIRDLLLPDGVFVFEVSYIVDLIEKNVFDTIYHEHLCHHSIGPLIKFLKLYDLELFDVERNKSKGGSIRCFAQKIGAGRRVSPVVQEMLQSEIKNGYEGLARYHEFSMRLAKMHHDLGIFLKEIKNQGKKIAAYGASNPGMTILFQFELYSYIDKIYDDNPTKIGMVSPYAHLPVVSSDQMYVDKPDYIVLLAWAYEDRIVEKHQKYLNENGGRFILPIPQVKIVG